MELREKIVLSAGALIGVPTTLQQQAKLRNSYGWLTGNDYKQKVLGNIEDAIAKPEDFLGFNFRHISACIVGGGSWKATEFTEEVLRAALPMFSKKPSYVNHEMENVNNIIGYTGDLKWIPKRKVNGQDIPGGVEGPIFIDGKLHTDLCRQLSSPVPQIQSVSITVDFLWKPSHEFKNSSNEFDEYLFRSQVGQIVNGTMVRKIVTKIIEVYETSLVWLGADPFAKILDSDGNPFNIEKSAVVAKAEYDKDPLVKFNKEKGIYFVMDNTLSENSLHLRQEFSASFSKAENSHSQTNQQPKMSVIKFLAEKLNITEDEVTVDKLGGYGFVATTELQKLKDDAAKLPDLNKKVTDVTAERDGFKTELDTTKAELEKSKPLAEYATSLVDAKRKEVTRLYKLSLKGKAVGDDDATVKLIAGADAKALDGMLESYGGKVNQEFGAKCAECGSDQVSFRSSENTEEGDEEKKPTRTGGRLSSITRM